MSHLAGLDDVFLDYTAEFELRVQPAKNILQSVVEFMDDVAGFAARSCHIVSPTLRRISQEEFIGGFYRLYIGFGLVHLRQYLKFALRLSRRFRLALVPRKVANARGRESSRARFRRSSR